MPKFEPVIGLEVHAELATLSKMFCGCPVVDSTSAEPNSSVCEICTGMPGTLPVINQRAIEYALRVALALNCNIAETSVFARKNYFYPDLPKGFQISQYELPLAQNGWLDFETENGERRIRIRRVHLEEDTGKLLHREGYSLVDFNRSGVPLLEIVSEPDMRSTEDVKVFATSLRSILRYLEASSGDMEKGAVRFEANISLRPLGTEGLGTRTEVKNLNSFRAMVKALDYEIERQDQILAGGGEVKQETVGWDEVRGVTVSQRGKEEAHDYRYFPEPDLPPLHIDPAWIDRIRIELPELPSEKKARFVSEYHLTPYTADLLVEERAVADYFEVAVAHDPDTSPTKIANWLTGEYFSLLNLAGVEIDQSKVSPQSFAELVAMVEREDINATSGKEVLEVIFETGDSPIEIVESRGLAQLNDPQAIMDLVNQVLAENPKQVEQYLAGKTTISQWLFGQVMRAAGGRANPALLRTNLEQALKILEESCRSGG
ncbi:MAG TPA: Asp-tRNA(Asn)/Glu-tRNA(Gln) amidotransferase subunit GatB [Anaerolineae bacterium]|nr:Asp-tRNA(Asn)/Glu-tRNA(Gln) amidotransferase subunit GatB [Anaerolineae bacterium]